MKRQDYIDEINANLNASIEREEIFYKENEENVLYKSSESKEEARNDCSRWVYSEISETPCTFVIPDGLGTVTVTEEDEEGTYYRVLFKVRGKELMLKYWNRERLNDDNFIIRQPFPGDKPGNVAL